MLLILDGKSERVNLITEKCQECIAVGIGMLESTIRQLFTGRLSVAKLKLLTAGTANFLEVYRVVEKNAQNDVFNVPQSGVEGMDKSAVLQKVMMWRQTEQQSMESMCVYLSYFVAECADIQSGWWWSAFN